MSSTYTGSGTDSSSGSSETYASSQSRSSSSWTPSDETYSSDSGSESGSSCSSGSSRSSGSGTEESKGRKGKKGKKGKNGTRSRGSRSDATKSELHMTDDEIMEKYEVPRKRMKSFRRVFDRYDVDGDGVIDARELKKMLEMLNMDHSAADVQLMLDAADMDSDNLINFSEFVQMMVATQKTHLAELYEAFKVFDDDDSGFVDEEELGKVMSHLGKRLDGAQLRKMLAAADTDHDGRVSFAEFARILGYDGELYTVEELEAEARELRERAKAAFSNSSSDGYDSQAEGGEFGNMGRSSARGSGKGDRSRDESSSSVEDGYIKVRINAFYLGQRYKMHISRNAPLKSLARRLAKMTGYGVTFHRLYYEGFHLDFIKQGERTLAELNIDGLRPLFFIFLRGKFNVSHEDLFDTSGRPSLPVFYDVFLKEELIPRSDAMLLVDQARGIMRSEPNMIEAWEPMTVIGDIHGQFFDLVEIFRAGGKITGKTTHMFLGDYGDRGYFSIEVILYLLAAKIRYPDKVFLLRGNHESRKTAAKYGTMAEAVKKYGRKFYNKLVLCFDAMPLYALVHTGDRRILMMHGGISRHIETIDQIESINRFTEPPKVGPLKDCLWTDPAPDTNIENLSDMPRVWQVSKLKRRKERAPSTFTDAYFHASDRGSTLRSFGQPAVASFLKRNKLISIFRAHEQKIHGYDYGKYGPEFRFPGVVTVFSAPNYTDEAMNQGAVVTISHGKIKFRTYRWRLHPIYYPADAAPDLALEKNLKQEDFVQFLNWLHPAVLRKLPLSRLTEEFHAMFVVDKSSGSGTSKHYWTFLDDNLMDVLQLSKSPQIRKKYRAKTKAMVLWYAGYDLFTDTTKAERAEERHINDDSDTEGAGSSTKAVSKGGKKDNCVVQ